MFSNSIVEFVAYEQHQARLVEAERIRLVKSMQWGKARRPGNYQKVTHWLGGRLVEWGLKLQGHSVRPISQVTTAGGSSVECPSN
jgi:hypothetical protein